MNTEYDFSAATEAARNKVQRALETTRQRTGDVVARSGQYVRERPASTVLSAFALGVAVGALVALATRPQAPRSVFAASLDDSRDRLAEVFGTVAANLRAPLERTRSNVSDGSSHLVASVTRALEKVCPTKKHGWW